MAAGIEGCCGWAIQPAGSEPKSILQTCPTNAPVIASYPVYRMCRSRPVRRDTRPETSSCETVLNLPLSFADEDLPEMRRVVGFRHHDITYRHRRITRGHIRSAYEFRDLFMMELKLPIGRLILCHPFDPV